MRDSRRLTSARTRRGINRPIVALSLSAGVLLLLIGWLSLGKAKHERLIVYCAAGLRQPLEAIRQEYAAERGIEITIQYGGSNTLLANLKLSPDADVFLPADESYIDEAKKANLLGEALPVAQMRPILAVKKGNPLKIHSLRDLLENQARISMTEPSSAATGKLVQSALMSAGKWEQFKGRVTVFKGSVTEVATDLQVGAADAGIIWDAMLAQLTELEAVQLEEFSNVTARVVIAVCAASKQQDVANDFADFVAAPDKGQQAFRVAGFSALSATSAEAAP